MLRLRTTFTHAISLWVVGRVTNGVNRNKITCSIVRARAITQSKTVSTLLIFVILVFSYLRTQRRSISTQTRQASLTPNFEFRSTLNLITTQYHRKSKCDYVQSTVPPSSTSKMSRSKAMQTKDDVKSENKINTIPILVVPYSISFLSDRR